VYYDVGKKLGSNELDFVCQLLATETHWLSHKARSLVQAFNTCWNGERIAAGQGLERKQREVIRKNLAAGECPNFIDEGACDILGIGELSNQAFEMLNQPFRAKEFSSRAGGFRNAIAVKQNKIPGGAKQKQAPQYRYLP